MSKVLRSALQTVVLDDTAAHKLQFDFRDFIASDSKPHLSGNVAIWFEINLNEGSDNTDLTLKSRAMGLKPGAASVVIAANDIQTHLNSAGFTDTKTYSYPISLSWGAAHGLEIEFTYGVGATGSKEATVEVWLEVE